MANNTKIGERIKQAREERGLTLEELAKELGLNKSTIQRYESAKIGKIKLPIIEAIAQKLNVNPEWLSDKTDIRTTYATPASTSSLSELMKDVKRPNRVSGVAADFHCTTNKGYITGGIGNTTITSAVPIKNGGEVVIRGMSSPASESRINKVKFQQNGKTVEISETRLKTVSPARLQNQFKQSVLERTSLIYGDERTAELLKAFKSLNDIGRSEAVKRVEELTLIPAYQNDKQEDEQASSDTSKLTEYKK